MSKILSVQLSDAEYMALDQIAKHQDRSKGYVIRSLMHQYIEDFIDAKNAKKILKDIADKKTKTINWKELKKNLYKD